MKATTTVNSSDLELSSRDNYKGHTLMGNNNDDDNDDNMDTNNNKSKSSSIFNKIIKKNTSVINKVSLNPISKKYTSLIDDDDDDDGLDDDNKNFKIDTINPISKNYTSLIDDDDDDDRYRLDDDNKNIKIDTINTVRCPSKWRLYLLPLLPFLISCYIIIRYLIYKTNYDDKDIYIKHCSFNDYNNITLIDKNKNIHRIILFGDSLIGSPSEHYGMDKNLLNRISKHFPHLYFEIITSGIGGNKILDLKNRMFIDCIYCRPEAVIMYWDTDISNPPRDYLDSDDAIIQYKNNLKDVITEIKEITKYFAIAGPNLLGELPEGKNGRDKYLNLYRDINHDVSLLFNVTYIDIRQAFIDVDKEKGWDESSGYLTMDGEHPSKAGSKIEEDLFYNQLVLWYKNVLV